MTSRRRRRRRRTRHHPGHRRWRMVGYSAAGVLVLVALLSGVVLWDAFRARDALETGRSEVAAASQAIAAGEVEQAEAHFTAAREAIDEASRRTNRFLWRAAEGVPLAGRSFRTVAAVVDVGNAAADVGRQVVTRAGGLVREGGDLEIQVEDAEVPLDSLELAAASVGQIELQRLEQAVAVLEVAPATWVPEQIRDGRRQGLELADRALDSVQDVSGLLEVLPTFLGQEDPRRYFLAMQNNAELRGTGGFIGIFGVLAVDDGRFTLETTEKINVFYREAGGLKLPPVDAPEAYEERYSAINAAGFIPNTNADPDLPTVGPVMVDLYRERLGERIDGVIAMDPIGLSLVLEHIGPVDVPGELLADYPAIPDPVPPAKIPEVTMVETVETFGGLASDGGGAQDEFILGFAEAAFQRVFAGGWDAIPVGRKLAEAAAGRHLQLFSTNPGEQEVFKRIGIAGTMDAPSTSPTADLLAVTANNAAANKQDVHVGHSLSGRLRLLRDGDGWRREATLQVALDNPLPSSGMDDAILGSAPTATGRPTSYDRVDGFNRTWFTVWAPESSVLLGARDASGEELLVGIGQIHGELAVDHWLETEFQSSNHFEVDVGGPVEVVSEGPDLVYRLTLWRQAKAIPDRLDLSVEGPAGWDVAEVTLGGGGNGGGMGPYGDVGPKVSSAMDGRAVRVTGDVNRDLHIKIRFTKPIRERLLEWLRRPAF